MVDANEWIPRFGQTYGAENLKGPHVIPVIEALPFKSENPVVIDVGSGYEAMANAAYLSRLGYFKVACVDIGITFPMEGDDYLDLGADITQMTTGTDDKAVATLTEFLSRQNPEGHPQSDLLIFSEILNYVDYQQALLWFDAYLAPGGFMVVANQPGRGYPWFFNPHGVNSSEDLASFIAKELEHTILFQKYVEHDDPPAEGEDYEFMVLATQKPS